SYPVELPRSRAAEAGQGSILGSCALPAPQSKPSHKALNREEHYSGWQCASLTINPLRYSSKYLSITIWRLSKMPETKEELQARIETLKAKAYPKTQPGQAPRVDTDSYNELKKAQDQLAEIEKQELRDKMFTQIETAKAEKRKQNVVMNEAFKNPIYQD